MICSRIKYFFSAATSSIMARAKITYDKCNYEMLTDDMNVVLV